MNAKKRNQYSAEVAIPLILLIDEMEEIKDETEAAIGNTELLHASFEQIKKGRFHYDEEGPQEDDWLLCELMRGLVETVKHAHSRVGYTLPDHSYVMSVCQSALEKFGVVTQSFVDEAVFTEIVSEPVW